MKKLAFCMILSSLLLIPSIAFSYPFTATIDDNDYDGSENAFWGGAVVGPLASSYNNKDVIGNGFEVLKMDITKLDANSWEVVLTGEYFQNYVISTHLASQFAPGDLYINANGWNATTGAAPHYAGDTFLLTEGWNYVVTNGSRGWGLYTLGANYTDTGAPSSSYTYRDNQAWQGGGDTWIDSATSVLSGNTLTFTFNTGNDNWTDSVGFHWTMKCGNDVLEGMISTPAPPEVPEPSTLLLLGLGLTGVAVYKKFRS